jgi:hypothetical protein
MLACPFTDQTQPGSNTMMVDNFLARAFAEFAGGVLSAFKDMVQNATSSGSAMLSNPYVMVPLGILGLCWFLRR